MKTICDWNNCFEIGKYRAPIEKDNSKNFRLLCLKHIKEFNKNWNYFSGMSDEEVIDFLKSDMTWHKKTQSFSSSDNFFKVLWNNALKDEMDKMKFDNETSIIQQKIANGYAGVSRRLAIVNALNLETNETVIDIGCGGGHLVQEISLSIGEPVSYTHLTLPTNREV